MNLIKHISLNALIKISNQKLLLPLYHTVSDDKLLHIQNLYKVKTINEFKNELYFIVRYFYSVPISDVISIYKGEKKDERPVFHLTFDDGLKEARTIIAPILLEKGIHATFFVNPGFIDNKSLFYRFKASLIINKLNKKKVRVPTILEIKQLLNCDSENEIIPKLLLISYSNRYILDKIALLLDLDFNDYLKKEPYLSKEDVFWLLNKGFTIGAHSIDHPNYSDISLEEQVYQTNSSLNYIETNFKVYDKLFAFPFSDIGVKRDYFNHTDLIRNISFGTGGFKKDSFNFNLQRVPMEVQSFSAPEIIKGQYLRLLIRRVLGKNMIKR